MLGDRKNTSRPIHPRLKRVPTKFRLRVIFTRPGSRNTWSNTCSRKRPSHGVAVCLRKIWDSRWKAATGPLARNRALAEADFYANTILRWSAGGKQCAPAGRKDKRWHSSTWTKNCIYSCKGKLNEPFQERTGSYINNGILIFLYSTRIFVYFHFLFTVLQIIQRCIGFPNVRCRTQWTKCIYNNQMLILASDKGHWSNISRDYALRNDVKRI